MSFQTHEKQGLLWLTSESLALRGVVHGFSTRRGGVSAPPCDSLNLGLARGDEDACVRENYRRFCAAIGADVEKTVLSRQVHEDNVRLVTAADAGKGLWRERDYTSVDAMICREPGLALTVFSADCGIVLLYDPVRRAIGAVHAGWRGTALGLVKRRRWPWLTISAPTAPTCAALSARPLKRAALRPTTMCPRPCAPRWATMPTLIWSGAAASGTSTSRASTPIGCEAWACGTSTSAITAPAAGLIYTGHTAKWETAAALRSP